MFWSKVNKLCEEKGLSVSEMCRRLGLSASIASDLKQKGLELACCLILFGLF